MVAEALALCYRLSSVPYSSFHVVSEQMFFLLCLGCLSPFLTWLGWSFFHLILSIENGETKVPVGSSAEDGMKRTVLSPYTLLPFYCQEHTLNKHLGNADVSALVFGMRCLLFGIWLAVGCCGAHPHIQLYPWCKWLASLEGLFLCQGHSLGSPRAPHTIQHADFSITRLHACPWPKTSPMHRDSSNSRSLRTGSSKTNVSHSTSKNCIKPEETMLFLQVCFKSTQIFFWSQSYNSVKLDTILESPRKH